MSVLYNFGNDFVNKYIFTDKLSTPEEPFFTKEERWNIFIYIIGLMCYKFGLESYNGTLRALAVDRFAKAELPTYTYLGLLDGFNAAAQCVGSIVVGPLMKMFKVKTIIAGAIAIFAIISSIVMFIEKTHGGTMPTTCVSKDGMPPKCTGAIAGDWDPIGIIPVFVFGGIPYGVIEIVRRIIPQQIVGNDENKLKKMDSLVHVYYEITGYV